MLENNKFNEFCKLARQAIEINDQLLALLNEGFSDGLNDIPEKEQRVIVDLSKMLVLRRIEVVNCFEILIKLSYEDAIEILDTRYLGRNVCPDKKFGGFQSELDLMLNDFAEIRGSKALIEEVLRHYVSTEKINDYRVIEAFCEALNLNSKDDFELLVNDLKNKV